jgi:hypothetical protein
MLSLQLDILRPFKTVAKFSGCRKGREIAPDQASDWSRYTLRPGTEVSSLRIAQIKVAEDEDYLSFRRLGAVSMGITPGFKQYSIYGAEIASPK